MTARAPGSLTVPPDTFGGMGAVVTLRTSLAGAAARSRSAARVTIACART